MSSDETTQSASLIPTLRGMTEADRPELESLYDRMCPGRKTELGSDANTHALIVERAGKIAAAMLGTMATVVQVLLLADPDEASSPEAAHDTHALADAMVSVVRGNALAGSVVGAVVFIPTSLRSLGEALDRVGFTSTTKEYSAHVALLVNTPTETLPTSQSRH